MKGGFLNKINAEWAGRVGMQSELLNVTMNSNTESLKKQWYSGTS